MKIGFIDEGFGDNTPQFCGADDITSVNPNTVNFKLLHWRGVCKSVLSRPSVQQSRRVCLVDLSIKLLLWHTTGEEQILDGLPVITQNHFTVLLLVDFSHAVVPLGNQISFHLVLEQGIGYDLFSFGLEDVEFVINTICETLLFEFSELSRIRFSPCSDDILKGSILG